MSSELVAAHIEAQAQVRARAALAMAVAWRSLPSYDDTDVPAFLARAVPVTLASQRASVRLTMAFLARAGGTPGGARVSAGRVLSGVRNGVAPAVVYRRPFVTVWTALKDGAAYEDAVASGLDRATSAAQTDVQLAMRQTLVEVGAADTRILGYRRVPDPDACGFCRLIAGQRYLTEQLLPVHSRCGCGVEVITATNRGDFTGRRANDLAIPATVGADGTIAAVAEHGELGPLVVDGRDNFTAL